METQGLIWSFSTTVGIPVRFSKEPNVRFPKLASPITNIFDFNFTKAGFYLRRDLRRLKSSENSSLTKTKATCKKKPAARKRTFFWLQKCEFSTHLRLTCGTTLIWSMLYGTFEGIFTWEMQQSLRVPLHGKLNFENWFIVIVLSAQTRFYFKSMWCIVSLDLFTQRIILRIHTAGVQWLSCSTLPWFNEE